MARRRSFWKELVIRRYDCKIAARCREAKSVYGERPGSDDQVGMAPEICISRQNAGCRWEKGVVKSKVKNILQHRSSRDEIVGWLRQFSVKYIVAERQDVNIFRTEERRRS